MNKKYLSHQDSHEAIFTYHIIYIKKVRILQDKPFATNVGHEPIELISCTTRVDAKYNELLVIVNNVNTIE